MRNRADKLAAGISHGSLNSTLYEHIN